jgi:hypothetical protein
LGIVLAYPVVDVVKDGTPLNALPLGQIALLSVVWKCR